jgi:AcrR family transcriptional regulator
MTQDAPRRGRPPSIDRRAIAEAVLELGTANATMRRVAERLGVSLPGLYHHVKNKDELLRVAAQHALVSNPPPRYEGQHWAQWLRAYADYIRTALSAEPALLEKFLSGGVKDDGQLEYIAHALDALRAQGLEPDQAMSVWAAVTALAMGTVTETHRERIQAERGQPWLARIFGLIARSAPEDYPTLRAIAASHYDPFGDSSFDERITLLLNGIAAQYGLSGPA